MNRTGPSSKKKFAPPLIWLYITFGVIVLAMLVWSSLRTLRETPSRQVGLEVPGRGWLTVTLATNPFPPLPSGPVMVNVWAENSRGVMVDLGPSLPYQVGYAGEEEPFLTGSAAPNPSAAGYQDSVQFPAPGDYWLVFQLDGSAAARFQVYVEPAQ